VHNLSRVTPWLSENRRRKLPSQKYNLATICDKVGGQCCRQSDQILPEHPLKEFYRTGGASRLGPSTSPSVAAGEGPHQPGVVTPLRAAAVLDGTSVFLSAEARSPCPQRLKSMARCSEKAWSAYGAVDAWVRNLYRWPPQVR